MTTRRSQVQVLYGPPSKEPYFSRGFSLDDKALLLIVFETFPHFSPDLVFLSVFTKKKDRLSGHYRICFGRRCVLLHLSAFAYSAKGVWSQRKLPTQSIFLTSTSGGCAKSHISSNHCWCVVSTISTSDILVWIV